MEPIYAGYWRRYENGEHKPFTPHDSHLPWPQGNVLTSEEVDHALQILARLETRPDVRLRAYRGWSNCRLCGHRNGYCEYELTIGNVEYRWPEGLRHYIAEHRVALPEVLMGV